MIEAIVRTIAFNGDRQAKMASHQESRGHCRSDAAVRLMSVKAKDP